MRSAGNEAISVQCGNCGSNNPPQNNFCGICGSQLQHSEPEPLPDQRQKNGSTRLFSFPEPTPDSVAEPQPEPEPEHVMSIGGPSFLGLGDDPTAESAYLLDEDSHSSHLSGLVVLIVIAVLVGVGIFEWRAIQETIHRSDLPPVTRTTPPPAPPQASAKPSNDVSNSQSSAAAGSDSQSATPASASAANPAVPEPGRNADNGGDNAINDAEKDRNATEAALSRNAGHPTPRPQDDEAPAPVESTRTRQVHASTKTRSVPNFAQDPMLLQGEKYLYGRGVSQNCGQALEYFRAAAGHENPRAMAHIAAMYETGQCVGQNRVMAYNWFNRALAADHSNRYLQQNVDMVWRELSASEKAQVLASRH